MALAMAMAITTAITVAMAVAMVLAMPPPRQSLTFTKTYMTKICLKHA